MSNEKGMGSVADNNDFHEALMQMSIVEYTDNVVKQKLLIKESRFENSLHMLLGITSEFTSELQDAFRKNDHVNKREEFGDIEFFIAGLCVFEDLKLPIDERIPEIFKHVDVCSYMGQLIGDLNTIFKKELTSGVRKMDGIVVDNLQYYTDNLFFCLWELMKRHGVCVHETRYHNAKKLNVRYAAGYTIDENLNRDLDAERKSLES